MADIQQPETGGTIEEFPLAESPDLSGVVSVDVTDFQADDVGAGDGTPSSAIQQARIVTSQPNRDPMADGENRWHRGQLVRRPWGR